MVGNWGLSFILKHIVLFFHPTCYWVACQPTDWLSVWLTDGPNRVQTNRPNLNASAKHLFTTYMFCKNITLLYSTTTGQLYCMVGRFPEPFQYTMRCDGLMLRGWMFDWEVCVQALVGVSVVLTYERHFACTMSLPIQQRQCDPTNCQQRHPYRMLWSNVPWTSIPCRRE